MVIIHKAYNFWGVSELKYKYSDYEEQFICDL